ncbi:hypothetical protein ACUOCP_36675, partial [Escherichia sp. R-CC3]
PTVIARIPLTPESFCSTRDWRMLVECLSVGRGITLPSNSTGGVKSVALATGAYAHIRRQFKISIGKMEGIEEPLARIAGNAYVMDAAASLITYGIMLGEKPAVLSAIVKYHCTHRGLFSTIDEKTSQEKLTWLNVNDALS